MHKPRKTKQEVAMEHVCNVLIKYSPNYLCARRIESELPPEIRSYSRSCINANIIARCMKYLDAPKGYKLEYKTVDKDMVYRLVKISSPKGDKSKEGLEEKLSQR